LQILAGNYELGDIAKLEILLKSNWNEKLTNIYSELLMRDSQGDEIGTIKTASIDLEPNEEGTITAYWDTAGLNEGTYYASLKLFAGTSSIEKQFEVTLALTKLTTSLLGATARATLGDESSKGNILFVIVVILIIINISWFVFFKKRVQLKKSNKNSDDSLKKLQNKVEKLQKDMKSKK